MTVIDHTRRRGEAPTHAKRLDVQGLRAVAVVLVLLDHAGVPSFQGGFVGVDVFFVVSGFVITLSLMGRQHRRGISIAEFYAARARRILPMGTLVIALTLAVSWLVMNYVRAERVWQDGIWAGFFAINFHLGAKGTDYFNSDLPPSPLQHYWSLSVEEQFYLVWPLLLGGIWFGVRLRSSSSRTREIPRNRIAACLGVIIAASLGCSIIQTAQSPTLAYFSSLTRAWELGLGALVAVLLPRMTSVPQNVRIIAAWFGLACILAAALTFSASTPFPGYTALLPVVGTALVIAGGVGEPKAGTSLVLATPPFIYVGNISYSLYLWHWPILIVTAAYFGRDLPVTTNLALLAVAFALSAVSYQSIEKPMQKSEWLRDNRSLSLVFWPIAITAVLLVGVLMRDSVRVSAISAETPARTAAPVAPAGTTLSGDSFVAAVQGSVSAALENAPIPTGLSPSPSTLEGDVDTLSGCSAGDGDTTNPICTYGDPSAGRSIVVIGDSHTLMWVPTLDKIGKDNGWKVTPLVKHNCTAADVTLYDEVKGPNTECDTWRQWAVKQAQDLNPARILVGTRLPDWIMENGQNVRPTPGMWQAAVERGIRNLMSAGQPVTVISDAPGIEVDPVECLLGRDSTMATCTPEIMRRPAILNPAMQSGTLDAGAEYVDVTDWFCASGRCPTVIGNIIAYRDHGHVSKTYALKLAEPFAARFGLA